MAIESSCDETAASVVKNGRTILSNVISSQIELHKLYGGVVPEIASRKHIEKINQVIEEALKEAGVTLDDLDAVGAVSYTHLDVYKRQQYAPYGGNAGDKACPSGGPPGKRNRQTALSETWI